MTSILRIDTPPGRLARLPHQRCWLLGALMALIVALHLLFLPLLPQTRLNITGALFELTNWLTLLFMFQVVQQARLTRRAHLLLTLGVGLWALAATVDLMDEVVYQPLWVSVFAEDMVRTIGIALGAFGILDTMRYVMHIHEQLERQALSDELTQLPNRRHFRQWLEAATPLSMILIDLDHFKHINDRFGHDVGDMVLRHFGALLSTHTPAGAQAARLGGEEFALLLPGTDRTQVEALALRLLAATHSITLQDGTSLTVSLGLGCKGQDEPPERFFRRVDQALYRAKGAGRDRAEWACPTENGPAYQPRPSASQTDSIQATDGATPLARGMGQSLN